MFIGFISWILPQISMFGLALKIGVLATVVVIAHRHFAVHDPFGIANSITLLRGFVICTLLTSITTTTNEPPIELIQLALALAALVLDWIDGRAARLFHQPSQFGARFDVEIDSFFLVTVCFVLIDRQALGVWILILPALRPSFFVVQLWLSLNQRTLPLNRRRSMIAGFAATLMVIAMIPSFETGAALSVTVALALTVYSFAVDLTWLISNQSVEAAKRLRVRESAERLR